MLPWRLITYWLQDNSMALQLSAKEKFRAVFAVTTGKDQGIKGRMQGKLSKDIPHLNIFHPEVGGISFFPPAGCNNIANSYFFPAKKDLSLVHRFRGIVIVQGKAENDLDDRPELPVTAAVTKIDILFLQLTKGKPRWRQGSDEKLFRPFGNKNRVRMTMEKNNTPLFRAFCRLAICLAFRGTFRQGYYQ